MDFPLGNKELRIGILGMTEGNGHPYSWSAMFNEYEKEPMEDCGFPVIPRYLEKQAPKTFGIEGAHITCICCTGYAGRDRAEHIAHTRWHPGFLDAMPLGGGKAVNGRLKNHYPKGLRR